MTLQQAPARIPVAETGLGAFMAKPFDTGVMPSGIEKLPAAG